LFIDLYEPKVERDCFEEKRVLPNCRILGMNRKAEFKEKESVEFHSRNVSFSHTSKQTLFS